jgi:hypothetical protein
MNEINKFISVFIKSLLRISNFIRTVSHFFLVRSLLSNSIHVCYKGGQQGKDNRTPYQKLAMLDILIELKKQFPKAVICGHRDFSPDLNKNGIIEPKEFIKLCPCFDAKSEYKKL